MTFGFPASGRYDLGFTDDVSWMDLKLATIAAGGLLFFFQKDCQESKPAVPMTKVHYPVHRFEKTEPNSPGIALDTVTGQFCRTWDWKFVGKPNDNGISTLPTCIELFHSYQTDASYPTPPSTTPILNHSE